MTTDRLDVEGVLGSSVAGSSRGFMAPTEIQHSAGKDGRLRDDAITADWRDRLTPAEAKRLGEMEPILTLAKRLRVERREIELRARCRSRNADVAGRRA